MSASREKKQRLDSVGDLTPKQRRDLKEAQAKKRNKIFYTAIGLVALVLVAALLVWNSGLFQKQQTAATVNDQNFTVAQASYYYGYARQQELQMARLYQQFGMAYFDSSKPASQQIQDAESGKTYAEYFQEQALASLKQVVILCDQAAAEGYTLSDEGKAGVDTTVSSMKQYAARSNVSLSVYLKSMFGKYMTESIFREEATRAALAGEYQTKKTGGFTYTDEQLNDYYKENAGTMDTYEYYYAQIDGKPESKTDADGKTIDPTDEEKSAAMADAKEKADAMSAEIENGADFAKTAVKYVSDAEKASYEADPEYRHQAGDLGSNLTSSAYGQWLTSSDTVRKAGDIGVVEDTADSCYFVVKLVNRWRAEDTYATVDARHILVKAQLDDGATEPTEAQYEAAKARIEEIKGQWEAGLKDSESFGQLATLNSEDPGSKDNGGLYEGITRNQMFSAFNDFLFAAGRKIGDVGVVQNTQSGQQGYHLIYINGLGELYWRYTAEEALRSGDYSTWYDGIAEGYEALAASGMSHLTK
ncbi:MAG: peptidylprolyl isomerase [Clostridia bacterium]|nr:peptidylprolyl isomerase [Clostridia bacterium]